MTQGRRVRDIPAFLEGGSQIGQPLTAAHAHVDHGTTYFSVMSPWSSCSEGGSLAFGELDNVRNLHGLAT